MDGLSLLRLALDAGLVVRGDGAGRLQITGPKRLEPLAQQLLEHKAAVLDALEQFEERAASLEYDSGLSRDAAEQLAWTLLTAQDLIAVPASELGATLKRNKAQLFMDVFDASVIRKDQLAPCKECGGMGFWPKNASYEWQCKACHPEAYPLP